MQLYTLPDITPAGSAVNLGTQATSAGAPVRAVWVSATASGSTVRYGDANVGAARGQVLPTGIPFNIAPRGANDQTPYDLSKISVYASGGDKISITYGY